MYAVEGVKLVKTALKGSQPSKMDEVYDAITFGAIVTNLLVTDLHPNTLVAVSLILIVFSFTVEELSMTRSEGVIELNDSPLSSSHR